jgi:hypothetical protein
MSNVIVVILFVMVAGEAALFTGSHSYSTYFMSMLQQLYRYSVGGSM